SPIPENFKWKNEFINLYLEQYGFLPPDTRKLIFLIANNDLATIRTLTISIEDLKANNLVLIKTATRLKQQDILEYFYFISQQASEASRQQDELGLLSWAVSRNQWQESPLTDKLVAVEAGFLDTLQALLKHPENRFLLNASFLFQLHSKVILSGQIPIMRAFNDFITLHKSQASTSSYSARIDTLAKMLPKTIEIAASCGVIPIFRLLYNQLREELDLKERQLDKARASFSSIEAINALKEDVENAKAEFDHTMQTVIISAIKSGQIAFIEYILKYQLHDFKQNLNENSALFQALLQQAYGDCKKFLIGQLEQAQWATAVEPAAEGQTSVSSPEARSPYRFLGSPNLDYSLSTDTNPDVDATKKAGVS
ncbi:hypothetical protein, partial [Legionella nautarum]